jgi:hypothetical protein
MSHKTRPQTRPGKARPDIAWLPHLAKSSQPSGARLAAAYYRITARASVTTLAIETFEMDEVEAPPTRGPALSLSPSQSDSPFRSTYATGSA